MTGKEVVAENGDAGPSWVATVLAEGVLSCVRTLFKGRRVVATAAGMLFWYMNCQSCALGAKAGITESCRVWEVAGGK